jgi:hypothetical protein
LRKAAPVRDFRDFLALGVGSGFFNLEQLTYKPELFLRSYPLVEQLDDEQRELLRLLRVTFGVEPWTDPRARLDELKGLESAGGDRPIV